MAPPASSAPRCASPSMPRASPLTTTSPAAASSRPSIRATDAPYGEHDRAPTTATAGRSSSRRLAAAAEEEPDRRIEDRGQRAGERRRERASQRTPLAKERGVRCSSNARANRANAAVRGSLSRWEPVSRRDTPRPRARSRVVEILRHAVRERLRDVLRARRRPTPASAAIVRATRATRARPRPDSGSRSTARRAARRHPRLDAVRRLRAGPAPRATRCRDGRRTARPAAQRARAPAGAAP